MWYGGVMEHAAHAPTHPQGDLNRLALSATVHCLTGCAMGRSSAW